MVAMRSPSWTTSPSPTCSLARVPASSARTGISIFIDSRMTRVSPSSTWSPSVATTFQTFATISARTSATHRSSPGPGTALGPDAAAIIVLPPGSGAQPCHDGRVVVAADERLAREQVGVERQVRLRAGEPECRHRLARQSERLVPGLPVHAQLGEQRVVERRDVVARPVAGVHPDPRAGGLLPLCDRARAGQEPYRV